MPKKRRKTRRNKNKDNPFSDIDLSKYEEEETPQTESGQSFADFKRSYEKLLYKAQHSKKAYKITFKHEPDLIYVAFTTTKSKGRWQAVKYFQQCFHPSFTTKTQCSNLSQSRASHVSELDKYAMLGKAPIPELMKALNVSFPCSVCGKHKFDYSDYEIGRCFIVEGEGDLNPFTDGYILCYDCYRKYLQ